MKKNLLYKIVLASVFVLFIACNTTSSSNQEDSHKETNTTEEHHDDHGEEVMFTKEQVAMLDIVADTLSVHELGGSIDVTGVLDVPPQNEAVVTTFVGANISKIHVVEGDKVEEGSLLATINHPDIVTIQVNYLDALSKQTLYEHAFNRQKKLNDAGVGSGKDLQEAESLLVSTRGRVKGFENQIKLLGLPISKIKEGTLYNEAPVRSPIHGFVEKVQIKSGQYVQPQTPMVEIVNVEHIHADLMVFEKDIPRVKMDQKVLVSVGTNESEFMEAYIYSVGKSFEEGPKAVHVHAELENESNTLLPGMYAKGKIIIESNLVKALPEDAIFEDHGSTFVFVVDREGDDYSFKPSEVMVTLKNNGYAAIRFKNKEHATKQVVQQGTYYILAELKKSEAEHSH